MTVASPGPLFTVVIPLHNRAELVRPTLEALDRQEFRDFEVIVVDDGSTDDLTNVLRDFQNRVQFVRQENSGPGAARNRGAELARGDYVAYLDSDDVWLPWTLGVYAEVIAATQRPALLSGNLFPFTHEAELQSVSFQPAHWRYYADYLACCRHGWYCGSCQAVIRRDVLQKSGGFSERRINAEDHDLTLRLGVEPGFVFVDQPVMVGYRQHSGAMTRNLDRSFLGTTYLLDQERKGRYPGGIARRRQRRRILTGHVRPLSLALLRQGDRRHAWQLYHETLGWNLKQGRLRYLAAFPALFLAKSCTKSA